VPAVSVARPSKPSLRRVASRLVFPLALFLALALPASAFAAVTVGPAPPNPDPLGSQSINYLDGALIFNAVGPAGSQAAAPSAGVITRWRFYSDEIGAGTTVQLRTLALSSGTSYTAVASGPVEQVAAVKPQGAEVNNVLHEFAAQVPIAAGQLVGYTLHKAPGVIFKPVFPVGTGWKYGCMGCIEPAPADGETAKATLASGLWMAMNADVEPDADGDRLGDETQDPCVGICLPPVTTSSTSTAAAATTTAPAPAPVTGKKKCPKGKKPKRGKCVKKKHKKHHKPKK